jgi:hypothetical protein
LAGPRVNRLAMARGSASAIRFGCPLRDRRLHLHRFHTRWNRRSNILIALRRLTSRRAKQVVDFSISIDCRMVN